MLNASSSADAASSLLVLNAPPNPAAAAAPGAIVLNSDDALQAAQKQLEEELQQQQEPAEKTDAELKAEEKRRKKQQEEEEKRKRQEAKEQEAAEKRKQETESRKRAYDTQRNLYGVADAEAVIAVSTFLSLPFTERHRLMCSYLGHVQHASKRESLVQGFKQQTGLSLGQAELDFVVDELIAAGASRGRRRYRRMTDRRFFALVTGHAFTTEPRSSFAAYSSSVSSRLLGSDGAIGAAAIDFDQMSVHSGSSRGGGGGGGIAAFGAAGSSSALAAAITGQLQNNHSGLLCIGDCLEGVPESIIITRDRDADAAYGGAGPTDMRQSNKPPSDGPTFKLKARGSRGMVFKFESSDLPQMFVRPCLDAIQEATAQAERRGRRPPAFVMATPAMKNATICGRLREIDLATGECSVTYEANSPSLLQAAAAQEALKQRSKLAEDSGNGAFFDPFMSSRASRDLEVASIRSEQLEAASRGLQLVAGQHPLFRNCNHGHVLKAMQNAQIGEVLIRPTSTPHLGDIYVCVKMGEDHNSVVSIPVFEERRPSGRTYYRLVDEALESVNKSLEFDDLDHLLERYVRPMGKLMLEMTKHRRFCESRPVMMDSFRERLTKEPNAFMYGILEVPEHARCVHQLCYASSGLTNMSALRITASGDRLLMQHPERRDRWLYFNSVEDMVSELKRIKCGKHFTTA